MAEAPQSLPTSAPKSSPEISTAVPGPEWDAFVQRHGGSFYHLFDWGRVNAQCFGHETFYLGARQGDVLTGVMPLTLITSAVFGRILCSMPFVNFGGPCAANPESLLVLLAEATRKATELKAKYLELRCVQSLPTNLPCSLQKVSMTIDLDADPDVVWGKFTSKHRTAVRRAQKNGLVIQSGGLDLLDEFYDMMVASWHRLGTPIYSRRYFETILRTFPELTRIFVCRQGAEAIAVAFNGYFHGTVEGMWAGGGPRVRELQANYVLYWEMIRDACVRGCKTYHLGRSTAESGAEDFKKKWNASSHQLYWYFFRPDGGAMPALNVDNPKFRLAIATWRKLPEWATRMLGPPVAKFIP